MPIAPAICSGRIRYSGYVPGRASDKGYNMLVACYDMYFNRFPLHPLSNMRIGTISSRFRDCAALISYGYIMSLLGMPNATDVMDCVFIEQIGNDIDRMMTSEDELLDNYSYFPYHIHYGLVTKSAFSATANHYFFEWVHMLGALLKSPRSLNARHINESRAIDILANASCVAFAYSSTFAFSKVYTTDGTALEMITEDDGDDELDDERDEMNEILKSRDAGAWCTLLQSLNGDIPQAVKQFVLTTVATITEAREGTIEEHIKVLADLLRR